MGAAARDDRAGRHAADPAPQLGDRRRFAHDGRDAGRNHSTYAGSDLLCYRAEEPEELAERQRLAFDPILAWAAETLGARFSLAAGVMHVEQPPESIEAIRSAIEDFDDPVALAALSAMTTLSGSALLALAVARGRLSPEEAWRAAHVDEDFEIERWGADAEASARRDGALAGVRGGGLRGDGASG